MARKGWYGRPDIGKKVSQKRRGGATWGSIADDLGISTGTLYNWRTGKSRMRESTAERVRDEILYEQVQELETITWSEAQAEKAQHGLGLEPLDIEQADLFFQAFGRVPESNEEVRRMTIEKEAVDPETGRLVKWKILYGRSGDARVKAAAVRSLQRQGLTIEQANKTYNDNTGYTTA